MFMLLQELLTLTVCVVPSIVRNWLSQAVVNRHAIDDPHLHLTLRHAISPNVFISPAHRRGEIEREYEVVSRLVEAHNRTDFDEQSLPSQNAWLLLDNRMVYV